MSRSPASTATANRSTSTASWLADWKSNDPFHTRYTPTETVLTPKYCTVAKSVSVSIITSASPAASDGRASGSTTRQNARVRLAPSVRAASYVVGDDPRLGGRSVRVDHQQAVGPTDEGDVDVHPVVVRDPHARGDLGEPGGVVGHDREPTDC